LSRSIRAIVIGAGITGTLTARELCLAGFDVTVLEAAHIGAGSSSRTNGGIRQQFSTPDTVRGMRYAVRSYRAFAAEVEGGTSPIVQNGYLFLYANPATWEAARHRVVMQHEAGLTEVRALEGAALTDRFPWVDGDQCIGGTWCPTDGFLLPAVVYGEAARRAVELGARVVQKAPVVGARHAGGRLVAVETPKGSLEGEVFLDCTNAWARRTARLLGAEDLPVDPLKRYLYTLRRAGSMSAEQLLAMPLTISPEGVCCRPEGADSLQMAWAHPAQPEPDFSYEDQDLVEPDFSHKGTDAVTYRMWRTLARALPPIARFGGIVATSAGYYGVTPDHNPFLGYDRKVGNLIRLVGFSGHGAMFGPFTARVALALAEAGEDVPTRGPVGRLPHWTGLRRP
jgi:sarcosine oxidase subunit beta